MTVADIKKSFHDLTLEERLRLLHDLWDDLASDSDAHELSAEDQAELERRYDEHLRHPEVARPWQQVKSDIRGRH